MRVILGELTTVKSLSKVRLRMEARVQSGFEFRGKSAANHVSRAPLVFGLRKVLVVSIGCLQNLAELLMLQSYG